MDAGLYIYVYIYVCIYLYLYLSIYLSIYSYSYQRESIRVDARRGEAQQHIARHNFVEARQNIAALDGADGEAGEVVVSRSVPVKKIYSQTHNKQTNTTANTQGESRRARRRRRRSRRGRSVPERTCKQDVRSNKQRRNTEHTQGEHRRARRRRRRSRRGRSAPAQPEKDIFGYTHNKQTHTTANTHTTNQHREQPTRINQLPGSPETPAGTLPYSIP